MTKIYLVVETERIIYAFSTKEKAEQCLNNCPANIGFLIKECDLDCEVKVRYAYLITVNLYSKTIDHIVDDHIIGKEGEIRVNKIDTFLMRLTIITDHQDIAIKIAQEYLRDHN